MITLLFDWILILYEEGENKVLEIRCPDPDIMVTRPQEDSWPYWVLEFITITAKLGKNSELCLGRWVAIELNKRRKIQLEIYYVTDTLWDSRGITKVTNRVRFHSMVGTEEVKNNNTIFTPPPEDSTDASFLGHGCISIPTLWMCPQQQ